MPRILKPFEYLEPTTLNEAVEMLSRYGPGARVLAGGVGLVEAMRGRELEPQWVLSLQKIPGLDYIQGDGSTGLRIGALTPLRAVELSPTVRKDYLLLHEAAHQIASVQVKSMGTLVGNICCGTPASDLAPPLLALDAELKTASTTSPRTIPVESFFLDAGQTALRPDEIVTEISMPAVPAGMGGAFLKLARVSADIAKVNVAVTIAVASDVCQEARIALGAVAPTPIRAKKAEDILRGQRLGEDTILGAAEAAATETQSISDVRSTAEYRREMTRVLVKRALEKAWERAKK
jgi:carbon-monoxide dehydrogenase medium subunit